jgi:hypothetical protein
MVVQISKKKKKINPLHLDTKQKVLMNLVQLVWTIHKNMQGVGSNLTTTKKRHKTEVTLTPSQTNKKESAKRRAGLFCLSSSSTNSVTVQSYATLFSLPNNE